MAGLQVRLLGAVEVRRADGPWTAVLGSRLQAVFAILALRAPHAVSADLLIDELWGDEQPGHPENALQARISQLRRVLEREAVVRRDKGYALAVEAEDVDAVRLESVVRLGREALGAQASADAYAHFTDAVVLLRGPPLGDLLDYRFVRAAATRLEELALAAHEGLADARLVTGRHAEAIGPLTELVETHPLRERFHAQLVLALYRSGRQADALRAYQAARTVLLEELGLEPGAELQALEQGVLAHDPALIGEVSFVPDLPQQSLLPGDRDLEAWKASREVGVAAVGRLPIVGRTADLASTELVVAEGLAGPGRVLLVEGEPGIGKTRLVEELVARAAADSAIVAWGRSYDGRGAPTFWPWIQVVESLLSAATDEAALAHALEGSAADLAQIIPEVKEHTGPLDPPPPLDPEAARFRVYNAITRFVTRLSASNPVVVVLDDLQWADPSSMELLSFLGGALERARVVVCATYRTIDPTISESLTEVLAQLSRQPAVHRVRLAGLDTSGLEEYLACAGIESNDDVIATLQQRTGGNPFFVGEIARMFPLVRDPADARAMGRAIPSNVKDLIRRRVGRLPMETTAALTASAVLGHDFELSLLATILDVDAATVLERLEPAVDAAILIDSPEGAGRYRSSHGLVHEVLYADMGLAQRARLHRRAAEAMEDRYGADEGPHLFALTEHWFRAVPVAPVETGIAYARQTAMWALGHVAYQQAEELLHTALELVRTMPATAERAALELDLLDQLSMVLIVTTCYTGEDIATAGDRTRTICDEIGDPVRVLPALWRVATFRMMRGEIAEGLKVAAELHRRGAAGEGLPPAVLAGHICDGILQTQAGALAEARRHLDLAIQLCDEGHDAALIGLVIEEPAVFARVFSSINWWLLGDEKRAERDAHDALAIASRESMQPYSVTLALWGSSNLSTLRQDAATTVERSTIGIDQALTYGYAQAVSVHGATLGWAHTALGRHEDGPVELRAAADAFFNLGSVYLRPTYLAFHADACLLAGEPAVALASAEDGLAMVEQSGEAWFEAELHRLRGLALLELNPSDPAGKAAVTRAVEVASAQGSATLEARAEATLATLR